ncbi:MAG: amidohydrolase [Chloroflexi bacterium]|nr:amidohydrolase [Chloroflexota bacterium]
MRVDVHAHHYPAELMAIMENTGAFGRPHGGPPVTMEQRLELMSAHGIARQIISVGSRQPYSASDPTVALAAARQANDVYAETVSGIGPRLAAFGCLPLPHLDFALSELARCLDELRMPGINLGCSVAGRALDEPEFDPLWQELNRRQAVVFLHPLALQTPMIDSLGLAFLVGTRFEDTLAAVRLVLSGLTTRYLDVKVIVSHLGGAIPYMWARVVDGARRNPDKQVDGEKAFRRLFYDSVSNAPAAMLCACQTVGASQILFGTDYPYLGSGTDFGETVRYIEQAGIPQAEVDAILNHNAQRVLGMPDQD